MPLHGTGGRNSVHWASRKNFYDRDTVRGRHHRWGRISAMQILKADVEPYEEFKSTETSYVT